MSERSFDDVFEKYIVDRMENGFAVCEQGSKPGATINLPLSELPEGVKEGNYIIYSNGKYIIDSEGEQEARRRIRGKMDKLFKKT